jgi:hypothetical protein
MELENMTEAKDKFLEMLRRVRNAVDVHIKYRIRGSYVDIITQYAYETNQPNVITLHGFESATEYLWRAYKPAILLMEAEDK